MLYTPLLFTTKQVLSSLAHTLHLVIIPNAIIVLLQITFSFIISLALKQLLPGIHRPSTTIATPVGSTHSSLTSAHSSILQRNTNNKLHHHQKTHRPLSFSSHPTFNTSLLQTSQVPNDIYSATSTLQYVLSILRPRSTCMCYNSKTKLQSLLIMCYYIPLHSTYLYYFRPATTTCTHLMLYYLYSRDIFISSIYGRGLLMAPCFTYFIFYSPRSRVSHSPPKLLSTPISALYASCNGYISFPMGTSTTSPLKHGSLSLASLLITKYPFGTLLQMMP
jgi:hypothetical protein